MHYTVPLLLSGTCVMWLNLKAVYQQITKKCVKSHIQGTKPFISGKVKHELRVQTHELGVQIHELRVQIHELRVQIHELRVQIHELED